MSALANGRRHEVDFRPASVRVEIYSSEKTIKIFTEADCEALLEEHRCFVRYSQLHRYLFNEATGTAARRVAQPNH
jgi:hypothetical protein